MSRFDHRTMKMPQTLRPIVWASTLSQSSRSCWRLRNAKMVDKAIYEAQHTRHWWKRSKTARAIATQSSKRSPSSFSVDSRMLFSSKTTFTTRSIVDKCLTCSRFCAPRYKVSCVKSHLKMRLEFRITLWMLSCICFRKTPPPKLQVFKKMPFWPFQLSSMVCSRFFSVFIVSYLLICFFLFKSLAKTLWNM